MKILPKKQRIETVVNLSIIILIFAFLLYYFKPSLLLLNTHISGGDTVSHSVLADYLKNYLLPHGKLIGWYPHWFAGVPMFQFYFVLPYLLAAILSYAIPLEIAFKLITVLGTFLIPVAVFFSMKLLNFKFPIPIVATVLTLTFLFLETNSYYGGNIPSTLAGESSYSLSLALMILLIGSLYKGMETKKLLIFNSVVLALVVLTHIYTAIILAATALFFLLLKKRKDNFFYLLKVFLLGFLLSSFWTLPFIFKLDYSSAPKELVGKPNPSLIYIQNFIPFYLLAVVSIVFAAKNRDKRIFYFCFSLIVTLLLFAKLSDYFPLLYIRFLPFLYIMPLLLAAIGLGELIKNTKNSKFQLIIPIIVFLLVAFWLNKTITFIPYWIQWNYEGMESKATWNSFNKVMNAMAGLNESGRVIVEYSASYDKFGSPRVFELSPVFTNKSVMEGLLMESSTTFPFYFYMQKEIAESTWWPGFSIKYPDFNLAKGAEHLRLYNVKYYVISSDKIKNEIGKYTEYKFLTQVENFQIYQLNQDSKYVELARKDPILVVTDDWRPFAYEWFSSDYIDVPLVFVSNVDEYDLSHFNTIVLNKSINLPKGNFKIFNSTELTKAMDSSNPIPGICSVNETLKEEEIIISTNCFYQPLLVKVSYFPNWQVEGAKKIYLVSPNLMMIIPEAEKVRIFYGETAVDKVASYLTVIGIFITMFLFARSSKFLGKVLRNLQKSLP